MNGLISSPNLIKLWESGATKLPSEKQAENVLNSQPVACVAAPHLKHIRDWILGWHWDLDLDISPSPRVIFTVREPLKTAQFGLGLIITRPICGDIVDHTSRSWMDGTCTKTPIIRVPNAHFRSQTSCFVSKPASSKLAGSKKYSVGWLLCGHPIQDKHYTFSLSVCLSSVYS